MVVRRQAKWEKKAHLQLPSMVQKRCMLKLSNVDENLEEKQNNLDNRNGKRKIKTQHKFQEIIYYYPFRT